MIITRPDAVKALVKLARGLVGCALIVSLSACSGDDGGGVEKPLTKLDVIARVDKICAEGQGQIEGLKAPRSLAASADFLGRVLPVVRANLNLIRAVGEVPAEDREVYLQWLQAREGIVQTTKQMIAAAEAKDEAEFRRLAAEQDELDERADKAARKYGFKVCGQST